MAEKTYAIESPYFVLHDKPSESFADLYALFLVKISRLPLEPSLSPADEARLLRLFTELNAAKRREEN